MFNVHHRSVRQWVVGNTATIAFLDLPAELRKADTSLSLINLLRDPSLLPPCSQAQALPTLQEHQPAFCIGAQTVLQPRLPGEQWNRCREPESPLAAPRAGGRSRFHPGAFPPGAGWTWGSSGQGEPSLRCMRGSGSALCLCRRGPAEGEPSQSIAKRECSGSPSWRPEQSYLSLCAFSFSSVYSRLQWLSLRFASRSQASPLAALCLGCPFTPSVSSSFAWSRAGAQIRGRDLSPSKRSKHQHWQQGARLYPRPVSMLFSLAEDTVHGSFHAPRQPLLGTSSACWRLWDVFFHLFQGSRLRADFSKSVDVTTVNFQQFFQFYRLYFP